MLAFFPLYAVLKPRLRHPAFIAALILLSPQTVLFQRNARLYPILILFYAVVLWLLSRDFRSRKWHTLATLLVFVLFFNTHPAAALGCAFALLLFCSLVRRQMFPVYLVAAGVGFLSWFVWYQLLAPALGDSGLYLPLIKLNPWRWLEGFFIATAAGVLDLDAVNLLPLLLWAGLLAILPWNRRAICVFKDPVAQFILLTLLVQAAANAAVFGCETMNSHSLLRYICYAAAFAMVLCFMMLDAIIRNRFIFAAASIFVVSFNLLTVSFWASPFPEKSRSHGLRPSMRRFSSCRRIHGTQPLRSYEANQGTLRVTTPCWLFRRAGVRKAPSSTLATAILCRRSLMKWARSALKYSAGPSVGRLSVSCAKNRNGYWIFLTTSKLPPPDTSLPP